MKKKDSLQINWLFLWFYYEDTGGLENTKWWGYGITMKTKGGFLLRNVIWKTSRNPSCPLGGDSHHRSQNDSSMIQP